MNIKLNHLSHKFGKLSLISAMVYGLLTTAPTHAFATELELRVDCTGSVTEPGWPFGTGWYQPTWAGSSDSVSWWAVNSSGWEYKRIGYSDFDDEDCGNWNTSGVAQLVGSSWTDEDTVAIRAHATGGDAFWIDMLYLFDQNSNVVKSWGANNSYGWCVSTDSSDCDNDYTPSKRAFHCLQFNLGSGMVTAC